jgi:hypothetical protein
MLERSVNAIKLSNWVLGRTRRFAPTSVAFNLLVIQIITALRLLGYLMNTECGMTSHTLLSNLR